MRQAAYRKRPNGGLAGHSARPEPSPENRRPRTYLGAAGAGLAAGFAFAFAFTARGAWFDEGVALDVALPIGIALDVALPAGMALDVALPDGVALDLALPDGVALDVALPDGVVWANAKLPRRLSAAIDKSLFTLVTPLPSYLNISLCRQVAQTPRVAPKAL